MKIKQTHTLFGVPLTKEEFDFDEEFEKSNYTGYILDAGAICHYKDSINVGGSEVFTNINGYVTVWKFFDRTDFSMTYSHKGIILDEVKGYSWVKNVGKSEISFGETPPSFIRTSFHEKYYLLRQINLLKILTKDKIKTVPNFPLMKEVIEYGEKTYKYVLSQVKEIENG